MPNEVNRVLGASTHSLTAELQREETKMPIAMQDRLSVEKTLMDSITEFIDRFVFLLKPELYLLVSTWIIATHLHHDFDYLGYLMAYSPERQSGKTSLLKLLNLLAYEASGLQVSPTPAVLFRTAKNHTQLLDEVDSWTNDADLKDVLNAGFEQSGVVTRCDNGKSGFKPKSYPVYAPRALAGIGLSKLQPTTLDRTFTVEMVRQTKAERRERVRPSRIKESARQLKKEIEKWVKREGPKVIAVYQQGKFPYLEEFSDRTLDISEPLAAIIEVMYEAHARHRQVISQLLNAIKLTRNEQHSPSPDHRVLVHLLQLAQDEDPLVGTASDLTALCANLEGPPTQPAVSNVLRKYGFKSKSVREPGGEPRYRYSLGLKELEEVVGRWVPALHEEEAPAAVSSGQQGVVDVVSK